MSSRQTLSKNSVALGLPSRVLFGIATLLISPAIAPEESLAFSWADSTAMFNFNNFSHQANSAFTETITDSFTWADIGSYSNALSQGNAVFINPPNSESLAVNSAVSMAWGEGTEFKAIAAASAKIVGNFFIEESQTFSFDFSGQLQLDTSIDRPLSESANAAADVVFLLFDSPNGFQPTLLDFFNVSANISTPGTADFLIQNQSSPSISLDYFNPETSFGGLKESAYAQFGGSFQQYFQAATNLTLVEVKATTVTAKAPEPSATVGLVLWGLGSLGLKARNRNKPGEVS